MKRSAVIGLVVFAALMTGFAGTAMALDCNLFAVQVYFYNSPLQVVEDSVRCIRGVNKGVGPVGGFVRLDAAGGFGPDCHVTIRNKKTNKTSRYRFQQNYCLAAAGNITVQKLSGEDLQIIVSKGSYPSTGGTVYVKP